MPFRYLGVPISSKRITTARCKNLVEEMTNKIRVYGVPGISLTQEG